MAQQPVANESAPLLPHETLQPIMEQQVEGRDHSTSSISPSSNIPIQPSNGDSTLSCSTSSGSSTIVQSEDQDESMPLLLSTSQNSTVGQQHEGREPNPHPTLNSPRVVDESIQPSSSGHMDLCTEQQHEHGPSPLPSPGELSPDIQHSVRDHSTSNIVAQQVDFKRQHCPFSLSVPKHSSIMLRRNAQAESSSAARASTSQETLQNLNPRRVKELIRTLGFDDQCSEFFYKLVIATAPFHNTESLPTPPAPEESNPQADALREALGGLTFPTQSPPATTAAKGARGGNSTDNPTGNLLFDANKAENHGSHPIEERSDSPPLLWSTAAVEESLDPNAEDPTYYTVAEFVNTIIEKNIQVESVTDEDWWIEDVRVAILNRLENDISEGVPIVEGDGDEVAATEKETTEQIKAKEHISKSDLTTKAKSNKVVETEEEASKAVQDKKVTSKEDLQRWEEQGPAGWLKREDGTAMNEEEIDEECARWDEMVKEARNKKEAGKAAALLGNNVDPKDQGFWEFMRSSKHKEQTKGSIPTHGQDEEASVSTHDQDEKGSQKKSKKGSRKNKNKNRKAKKNALKGANLEDVSEEEYDTESFPGFLDLPTQARKKVLGFVLLVHQELVPFHYVKDNIVKDVGMRKKPELNILLALCSSKDKKIKKCLDDAKNILYRDNTFSIRKPNDLIMFLGTIGGDNVARMKLGKNLLLSDGFFHKKPQYTLEMKWLARWGKDVLFAMKGHNIFRSDIAAENSEEDLTCEPTDIEKALKSMVQVLKDESKRDEMLKENSGGSGDSPTRLQSLDLGEESDSLAEPIKTMGLAADDSEVTASDGAKISETVSATDAPQKPVESMSEKKKRKALERGETVKDEDEAGAYGELFLKAVTAQDEDDEEEILSQESGVYTPSVYSEHGKQPISTANCSIDMIR